MRRTRRLDVGRLARLSAIFAAALLAHRAAGAQGETAPATGFEQAAATVDERLEASLAELARLREQVAAELLPLHRELAELERQLGAARGEHQDRSRRLAQSTVEVTNQRTRLDARRGEVAYLSNLIADYAREFESRLHVAELPRHHAPLSVATLALENDGLPPADLMRAQVAVLDTAVERLHDVLGGIRFEGQAIDPEGVVRHGRFAVVGPTAVFRSTDGSVVGSIEERRSTTPTATPYRDPEDALAAGELAATGAGRLPLDATLGDAHRIEATQETWLEHIESGGPVMVPIFVLAGLALLVGIWKWIALVLVRRPSRRQIAALLDAVAAHDVEAAAARARAMRGPIGAMLAAGVEHLSEPRELVEEVMYESLLRARLRMQRLLPFLAVCAAAAPLLGLLGTVTGIIDTFKVIQVFGSGDVKRLSGGISEALVTTEFGLIVAIPSLLAHAWLSRRTRRLLGEMETAAVALVNQVTKTPLVAERAAGGARGGGAPDPDLVRLQVREILGEMLSPLVADPTDADPEVSLRERLS